jgi:diguanylate cyclase (GGDEF)-like protein
VTERSAKSWLLTEDSDRERMLDMDRRLAPIRRKAFGVLGISLLVTGHWIGYWTLLPLLVAGALFAIADRTIDRVARPEYWIFGAWIGSQLTISISVMLAGDIGFPSFAWFAIPVVTLSTRFSTRGVGLGVAITIVLMLVVAFTTQGDAIASSPPLLVMPLGLVIAVAILTTAIMRSDVEHRTSSSVDPLTGLLNRSALTRRAEELREQSEVSGDPIALIVIDVDRFKDINDSAGHMAGDRVLQDLAYLIRKELRAYDLAYRLGGEEFIVLLPGGDSEQAFELAETLRESVAGAPLGEGLKVTICCGIAASRSGSPFCFDTLFEEADAAMYQAKSDGRNRSSHGPASERLLVTG